MSHFTLADAIAHWERIADDSIALAKWNREHGFDLSRPECSAGDHYAEICRRTAKALRLEMETGVVHCSICLGPHANHEHMNCG